MSDDASSISDDVISAYLDGEADTAQLKQVQRALETDPLFAARLERARGADLAVRTAFQDLAERPVPTALEAAVRAAAAGAAQTPRPAPATAPALPGWLRGWRAPAWIGGALAAQAALLVAAAVLLPGLNETATAPAPASYHALGARAAAPVANVLVMFRADAPEKDLRAAVKAVQGEFVGGPTPADAYLLRVPAERRDAALETLRRQDVVSMAEPIDPASRP